MSDQITKKDLEEYQSTILDAVNDGFETAKFERAEMRKEIGEMRVDITDIKQAIYELTVTLDAFLKRLSDLEDEFTILKAEMAQIKSVLKEKFDITISRQGD